MNSRQIENLLRNVTITRGKFLGVFPSDKIPISKRYPHCMVINTMREGTRGEHWIACFVPNAKNIEYFDSFGETPNDDLTKYLNTFKHVKINRQKIQFPTADTCGHYCVYFIVSRCSGSSYCHIMDTLYKTRALADWLVKGFVRMLIR